MSRTLNHFDDEGRPRMVDVGEKQVTSRRAVARGRLRLSAAGWEAIDRPAGAGKGDPFAVAQVAAIQAAKRCSDWIPMTHPLSLDAVSVDWRRDHSAGWIELEVEVRVQARTGVEMEALCGVSGGLLTLYDMLKAVDRSMLLGPIWLARKEGGRGGLYERGEDPGES